MSQSSAETAGLAADLRNAICSGNWDVVQVLTSALASCQVPTDPGEAAVFVDVIQDALEALRSVRARDIGLLRRVGIARSFSCLGSGLDNGRQNDAEVTDS